MFKRRKGYLLLTMLVLTGLAGRLHTDTLSGKERRQLINELKLSSGIFIKSIEGLSTKQLNFKNSKRSASINDNICRLAYAGNVLWQEVQYSLKEKVNEQKAITTVSDLSIKNLAETSAYPSPLPTQPAHAITSSDDAVIIFTQDSKEALKYARTATDNPRHRLIETPLGRLDVFQTILLLTYYTNHYTHEIDKIKHLKNFPH